MNQLRDRFINFLNSRPFVVAGVACFISLLMVFAQPGYRAFKKVRAASMLETSKQLVEEESYVQAFYKARTAVLLNTGNIEAGRRLATLALKFNHPQAHKFWETVIQNEKALPSDWAFAVDASFRKGDYATAFDYLLRWDEAGVEDPADFLLRQAQAYALSGQLRTANKLIETGTVTYPENEAIHTFYLQMFNVMATPEARSQLAQALLKSSDSTTADLEWIAFNSQAAKDQRLAAVVALLGRGTDRLEEELDLINLAAKLGWSEASQRIDAIGQKIDRSDAKQLASYTTALCLLGRYAEVLTYIDEESALEDRILLRNRLLAQIREGGVEEALDLTSQHRAKRLTTLAEETLLRALAFQQTGDQGQYKNNLNQAIDSANFEDLAFLEYQFKLLGETGALLDLYARISEDRRYGTQARAFWLNLAVALQSEAEIAAAVDAPADWLDQLLDPRQRANAIYYTLLYGKDKSIARHHAETLASSFREDAMFQFIAGFAYYQAGLKAEARQFTASGRIDPNALDPRSRYIAAVLFEQDFSATGQALLPREEALLR